MHKVWVWSPGLQGLQAPLGMFWWHLNKTKAAASLKNCLEVWSPEILSIPLNLYKHGHGLLCTSKFKFWPVLHLFCDSDHQSTVAFLLITRGMDLDHLYSGGVKLLKCHPSLLFHLLPSNIYLCAATWEDTWGEGSHGISQMILSGWFCVSGSYRLFKES